MANYFRKLLLPQQLSHVKVTIVFSIVLASACSTGGLKMSTHLPDKNSPAAIKFAAKCGVCHSVPHPGRLSYQAWVDLITVMENRMQERGMAPMTDEDKAIILNYVKTHSR